MATVDQMERERKRTVGKPTTTSAYKGPSGGMQPGFSAAVENVAKPARAEADMSWLKDPSLAGFVKEGTAQGLSGNTLATWVKTRAFPNGLNFGAPTSPKGGGGGTMSTQNANAPLMSALTQYATGMNKSAVNPAIQTSKLALSTARYD